eukprot:TRINITY_DN1314_c1_g1_i1.p1 TRINITY_DN1314_c1_g1~~TRINITY_DN1314_c1_g1_i1.p1  ORF type:complete len:641 (+),score=89.31 TRINITY_DN1314_c1_g1_i1:85-1923(+)
MAPGPPLAAPSPGITYRGTPLRQALRVALSPPAGATSPQQLPRALRPPPLPAGAPPVGSPPLHSVCAAELLGCAGLTPRHPPAAERRRAAAATVSAAGAERDACCRLSAAVAAREASRCVSPAPGESGARSGAVSSPLPSADDAAAGSAAMWASLRARVAASAAVVRHRGRSPSSAAAADSDEVPRGLTLPPGALRTAESPGGGRSLLEDTLQEWGDNPLYHDPVLRTGFSGSWGRRSASFTAPRKYSTLATPTMQTRDQGLPRQATTPGGTGTPGRRESPFTRKCVRTGPGRRRAHSAAGGTPVQPAPATPPPARKPVPFSLTTPPSMPSASPALPPMDGFSTASGAQVPPLPLPLPPSPPPSPSATAQHAAQPDSVAAALGSGFEGAALFFPGGADCPLSPPVERLLARRAKEAHATPPQARPAGPRRAPQPQRSRSVPLRRPPGQYGGLDGQPPGMGLCQADGAFIAHDWRPARRRLCVARRRLMPPPLQAPPTPPAPILRPRRGSSCPAPDAAQRRGSRLSRWSLDDGDSGAGRRGSVDGALQYMQEGVCQMAQAIATADGKAKQVLGELLSPASGSLRRETPLRTSSPSAAGHRKPGRRRDLSEGHS